MGDRRYVKKHPVYTSEDDVTARVITHVDRNDGKLVETVVKDEMGSFVVGIRDDDVVGEADEEFAVIRGNFKTLKPYVPEAYHDGMYRLPDGIEDYGTPAELFEEIREHIHTYVNMGDQDEKFCTWYVMFTWLFSPDDEDLSELPYLRFKGDIGTGKSRAVEVCGDLSYHSYLTDSTITEAALFRVTKHFRPTIRIDEADIDDSDDTNPLITLLLTGFSRNSGVTRCNLDNQEDVVTYPTFCPKIIGTRYEFGSAALESRCWTIHMSKSARKLPWKLAKSYREAARCLQRKLLKFRFDYYWKVDWDTTDMIMNEEFDGIEPRLLQATNVILALSSIFPDLHHEYKGFLTHANESLIQEMQQSPHGQVVQALFSLLREKWAGVTQDPNGAEIPQLSITPNSIAERMEQLNYGHVETSVVGRYLRHLGIETKRKWDPMSRRTVNKLILDVNCLKQIESKYIPNGERILTVITVITDITDLSKTVTYTHTCLNEDSLQVEGGVCNNRNNRNNRNVGDSANTEVETLDFDEDDDTLPGQFRCPHCGQAKEIRERCEWLGGEICLACYDNKYKERKGSAFS